MLIFMTMEFFRVKAETFYFDRQQKQQQQLQKKTTKIAKKTATKAILIQNQFKA